LTEDDCQNYRDQIALSLEWEGSSDEIPDIVRWIRPDEFFDVFAECIESQGFEAEIDRVHSMAGAVAVGPEQEAAATHADTMCMAMYPTMPGREHADLSDQTKRILYDYVVEELVPCLADQGWDVGEVPSYEVYWDRQDSTDPWLAYGPDLATWARNQGLNIEAICPQEPVDDRLDYLFEEPE
jgi:hypothetical protein